MTTILFVIANVEQLRTGGSFRILLPFFRTSWGGGVLNSAIFKFSQRGWIWHDFGGPSELRGGGRLIPPPAWYAAEWFRWSTRLVRLIYWPHGSKRGSQGVSQSDNPTLQVQMSLKLTKHLHSVLNDTTDDELHSIHTRLHYKHMQLGETSAMVSGSINIIWGVGE